MTETESCKKIFTELIELLNERQYILASDYLKTLYNGTISEMKSGLIMTKAFKEHEVMKDSRKKLLELFEEKLGRKSSYEEEKDPF